MERLANAIRIAAKLREESFDQKLANDEENNQFFDFNKCYKLTLREACDKAATHVSLGFDAKGINLVYLLLRSYWNESLEWADKFEEEKS